MLNSSFHLKDLGYLFAEVGEAILYKYSTRAFSDITCFVMNLKQPYRYHELG